MGNMHPNMSGLRRHKAKLAVNKIRRLVSTANRPISVKNIQLKGHDEYDMDLNDIEKYIEVTMAIPTMEISERTKASNGALKFMEVKHKIEEDTDNTTNINLIVGRAMKYADELKSESDNSINESDSQPTDD